MSTLEADLVWPTVAAHPAGATLAVRVVPRAAGTVVVGRFGNALKVKVAAPPVDGAANAALVDHLASRCELRRAAVKVLIGERSRDKVLLVCDRSPEEVVAALTR